MTEKYILLVDAGNNFVKWNQLSRTGKDNLSAMSRQQYPEKLSASFFVELWQGLNKPVKLFVSSVANKKVWQAIELACEQLWEIQPDKVVSKNTELGLVNAYTQPEQLGSDRWSAMIGACQNTDSSLLVVDCGSAITIDVITELDKDNLRKHIGGYILPGIAMMKQSLATHTAEVSVAKSPTPPLLNPSATTTGCVDAAIYLAAVKLIEAVFEQQQKHSKNITCLLTGGDAEVIAKLLSIKCILVPDLVMQGLAAIAKLSLDNKNNQGTPDS